MAFHISTTTMAVKFEQQLKRKVYNTPKSYLDFINMYMNTLDASREELNVNIKRLQNGLEKLAAADKQVAQLKIDLTKMQPELVVKSKNVEIALIETGKKASVAKEQETLVNAETAVVSKQAAEIEAIQKEAQQELDIVMPELEKALKAVEQIDKGKLIEMRSFTNPPDAVNLVMEGVLIMFGVKKYDWSVAKAKLQDLTGFLKQILEYDKENINEAYLKKLRAHMAANPDFDKKIMAVKAPAAADLCVWCFAMDTYSTTAKKIKPQMEMVAKLNVELRAAKEMLDVKQKALAEVKESVAKL